MKKLCFLALLSLVMAAGCSKGDTEFDNPNKPEQPTDPEKTPTLTIEKSDYTIAAEGGSVEASFEVNVDWTASVEYTDGDSKWLTLTPESGEAGTVTLTIVAEPNPVDTERRASVHILYGGETPCKLSVVQPELDRNADITAFFDPLFAQELQKRGYVADAKHITPADVNDITELDLSCGLDADLHWVYGDLTSLKGIEYFESLIVLDCSFNRLTSLNVSKNLVLTDLSCASNQLTLLDVSNNPLLTRLNCFTNRLTSLDVSKNPALEMLYCYSNRLTSLDVSKNLEIETLHCYYNQLISLNVSKNTKLWYLACYGNPGVGVVFSVLAWFDNNSIPLGSFTKGTWKYDGKTVRIDYRKVK